MRVMLADHDDARARRIAEACLARGHQVERVDHGASALERSLEQAPDAVICPTDLAVIDGPRLSEILRSNPRTRGASFIFLVRDELDAPLSMDLRDATVVRPWHEQDVLDDLDAVLERSAHLADIPGDTEIEGKLSQISVADLLQIFQMNLRSGTLRISAESLSSSASVLVREGQVIDALVPLRDGTAVVGEKALYRLLKWSEGRFQFVPGDVVEPPRIQKPTRVALLEGMRHRDEWDQLRREMPPLDSRVRVRGKATGAAATTPLIRDVLEAVETYRRISAIVDHCAYPDYQVLRCLSELLARGQVQLGGDESDARGASGRGLYGESQLRRLREWAASQRPRPGSVLKVLIAAGDAELLRGFVEILREWTDFVVDSRLARESRGLSRLCTLGHVPLAGGLSLRLIAVPADPVYEPLWDVACHGMLGAIIVPGLDTESALRETECVFEHLRGRGRGPVVHAAIDLGPGAISEGAMDRIAKLGGEGLFSLPARGCTPDLVRELFSRLIP